MTQSELTTVLGYKNATSISKAFNELKDKMPGLQGKTRRGPGVVIDYSAEEVKAVMEHLGFNSIEIELVMENFNFSGNDYIDNRDFYIEGTKEFLERWEKHEKDCICCDTCIFLTGRSIAHRTALPRPFCLFYHRFISTMRVTKYGKQKKVNIFVDRCGSWQKADKPLLFRKKI